MTDETFELMRAEINQLRQALAKIQWMGELGHWDEGGCSECHRRDDEGHQEDCIVGNALQSTKRHDEKIGITWTCDQCNQEVYGENRPVRNYATKWEPMILHKCANDPAGTFKAVYPDKPIPSTAPDVQHG